MEKYESLEIVGEGSYGVVLKCRDRTNGLTVAIKKFLEPDNERIVRKIANREVKILKSLRHENLVNLIEVFRKNKRIYLVFEFIEQNLLQEIEKSGNGLGETRTREIMFQVVRGIDFMHTNNFIHRDLKPENVLVNKNGLIKLCDFGFARKIAQSAENYTDYVATRWYRSPELLVGDPRYGKPVDIWSIGVLTYEVLTSKPLYPGESDLDQLFLIINSLGDLTDYLKMCFAHNQFYSNAKMPKIKNLSPLKNKLRRYSPDLCKFILNTLTIDPNKRPTSSELLQHNYFRADSWSDNYMVKLKTLVAAHEASVSKLFNRSPSITTNAMTSTKHQIFHHHPSQNQLTYPKINQDESKLLQLKNSLIINNNHNKSNDDNEAKKAGTTMPPLNSTSPTHPPTNLHSNNQTPTNVVSHSTKNNATEVNKDSILKDIREVQPSINHSTTNLSLKTGNNSISINQNEKTNTEERSSPITNYHTTVKQNNNNGNYKLNGVLTQNNNGSNTINKLNITFANYLTESKVSIASSNPSENYVKKPLNKLFYETLLANKQHQHNQHLTSTSENLQKPMKFPKISEQRSKNESPKPDLNINKMQEILIMDKHNNNNNNNVNKSPQLNYYPLSNTSNSSGNSETANYQSITELNDFNNNNMVMSKHNANIYPVNLRSNVLLNGGSVLKPKPYSFSPNGIEFSLINGKAEHAPNNLFSSSNLSLSLHGESNTSSKQNQTNLKQLRANNLNSNLYYLDENFRIANRSNKMQQQGAGLSNFNQSSEIKLYSNRNNDEQKPLNSISNSNKTNKNSSFRLPNVKQFDLYSKSNKAMIYDKKQVLLHAKK